MDDHRLHFSHCFDIAPQQWLIVHRSDFGKASGLGLYDWDAVRHTWGGLVWCFDGLMTAHVGDRRWLLTPADAVWLPPFVVADVIPNLPSRAIYVQWSGPPPIRSRRVRVDARAAGALQSLLRADNTVAAARSWHQALGALRPVTDEGLCIPRPTDPRGHHLAAALMDDPADGRSLGEWGEATYTSAKTLQRIVQRETGLTFPRWRTQIRLNASLPLLAARMPVQEVAASVGYRSSVGFIDAFSAHFATTPARFYRGVSTTPV